jgi:hypothetical protein
LANKKDLETPKTAFEKVKKKLQMILFVAFFIGGQSKAMSCY